MIRHPLFRIALLFIGVLAIWVLIGALRNAIFGEGYTFGGHVFAAVLASLLTVPLVVFMRRNVDGGTLSGMGLPLARDAIKPFAVGALAFLLPSALGFAIITVFGWTVITPVAPLWQIVAFIPVLIVLVFLYEALPEELAFRGYIYSVLAERYARIVAVIAQAGLFALWGTALWAAVSGSVLFERLVIFAFVAFVLGLVRVVSGSVWATIGLHTAFQTVAQLLLNAERGHFGVEGTDMMQLIALGVVPFSLATLLVGLVYRNPVAWRDPESRALS